MTEISQDNTYIKCIKTSELAELCIIKPDFQRIVDSAKVGEIVKFHLEFHKIHKHFNFTASGPINIHHWNDTNLLIDGQHRMAALERLYEDYSHDIPFYILMVNVSSQEELEENYTMINKNTPLPDFSEFHSVDKKLPENVASEFQVRYPHIWSKTTRSRRPHIFFNHFQETLAYICSEIPEIKTVQQLNTIISNYNTKLSSWVRTKEADPFKVTDKMYEKARKSGLFLGLYKFQVSERYGYDWARKIVEEQTGRTIKKTCKSKKKCIPKKLKIDIWGKYIGLAVGKSKCIVCKDTEILQSKFHGGHIVSEYNGGTTTLDNILPICSGCNTSMGTTNMTEYVANHYPKNYQAFLKRDYTQQKKNLFGGLFRK